MNNVNYFGVFDGHGGNKVSTFLHKNLANFFMDKRLTYPLTKNNVNKAYDDYQNKISKYNWGHESGSTCLVVVHFKKNNSNYLNVINTGDSRCILCRDNFAMPLTKDHKPRWPEEKARIEKMGGKIVFDGYDWRISQFSVSRAFGDSSEPYLIHRPDLFRYKLDKSDKFFVMACDGLWDVMNNDDVVNFVLINCYDSSCKIRINKNRNIAKMLAEYAIKKGSTDNITVIVTFLDD
jgi:serine/threonine protein phosphatase PrpC